MMPYHIQKPVDSSIHSLIPSFAVSPPRTMLLVVLVFVLGSLGMQLMHVPVFRAVIIAWTLFSFQMALNSGICCSQKPALISLPRSLWIFFSSRAVGVSYSAREVAENKSSPSHQYVRMSRWLNFH